MKKRTYPPPRAVRIASRAAAAAFLVAASAGLARAAFDLPALSAQSAAMGQASLARQGDSSALFLNPAALAGLSAPETYLMYHRLYTGLEGVDAMGQGFATVGIPTKAGAFAFGLSDFKAAGLLEERVVGLAFARRLTDFLRAGVTLKYLHHRYLVGSDPAAAADPVFANGTSRGGAAVDLGAVATLTPALDVGVAVRNLNQPDLGLASEDRVPREVAAGLAYAVAPWGVRVSADYVYRAQASGTLRDKGRPSVGFEKSLYGDRFKARLGAGLDQLSGGVGFTAGPLVFDYSFTLSRELLSQSTGNHKVGVRYRFGGSER